MEAGFFSSPMRDKIVALHGERTLRKSVISVRGGAGVITKVLEGKGIRTALEIGTYKGVGAAELSQYVDRVVTIDLKHGRMERHRETWDRVAFWRGLGIDNIELVLVEDDAEKAAFVNGLDFDFALVDGAHDATVANDFALVKRCGRVLFHDFDPRGTAEKDHVYNFVRSLPRDQVEPMDIFALWSAPHG